MPLQEQLALQQQLVSQFDVDLTARDELVTLLSTQLSRAEAEVEKYRNEVERRRSAMRTLRCKVSELEKICRGLEEEVERSREESFERSVMDEASEGALIVLQGSIGQLKAELEKAREDEVTVREERDVLKAKVEEVGSEWKEGEAKRAELEDELNEAWAAKGEVEHERDQLVEDVNSERARVEQLTQSLQERESKLDELEQERGLATDNVARLEALLRMRDAESAEAQVRIIEHVAEAEQLRAQIGQLKRDHGQIVDEQERRLDEIVQMEGASRKEMEAILRTKAEDQVAFGSAKEQLGILMAEVERLRRQVHDLQQASADKEVQVVQLTKARVRDEEDKEGLNIALDSKQQELELLKRKLGLKGTGGSTPAPNRVGLPDFSSRAQSVAFATPSAPRPRPRSVAGLMKTGSTVETPSKTALSSSVRGNATGGCVVTPSTMKPARVGSMGPPPSKRAPTNGASLLASTSSPSRSVSSSKPRTSLPVADNHRRSSSAMSVDRTVASPVPRGGKENAAPVKPARRTIVPP